MSLSLMRRYHKGLISLLTITEDRQINLFAALSSESDSTLLMDRYVAVYGVRIFASIIVVRVRCDYTELSVRVIGVCLDLVSN